MQTINEVSKQLGERYFTVSLFDIKTRETVDSALQFGTLEDIVSTMDATLEAYDPTASANEYAAVIAFGGMNIVRFSDLTSPDRAELNPAFNPAATTYEVREIDAWAEYDNPDDPDEAPSWAWNTSFIVGTFSTAAQDTARAFRHYLKAQDVTFRRGTTRTEYDGDVYEIVDRKTGQPLYAAVPMEA